jgi:hypothetical protein
VSSTPNDGSEAITIPASANSTACRIMIRAADNIFLDVNDNSFRVNGPPSTPTNVRVSPVSPCEGQAVQLLATASSGVTVDWFNTSCGVGFVGSGTSLNVQATNGATYFARARRTSDGQVSINCGSVTINATPLPTAPTMLLVDRARLCTSSTGVITLMAEGGIGTTVKWFSGGCGETLIGEGEVLQLPVPTATTEYFARRENACGASACGAGVLVIVGEPDLDFNNDEVFPDLTDILSFIAVFGGESCESCDSVDFNGDGVSPDTQDLLDFVRVFGGGTC